MALCHTLTHSLQNKLGERPVENTSRLSWLKLMLHSLLNNCRRSWVGSSFWTCELVTLQSQLLYAAFAHDWRDAHGYARL